MPPPSQLTTVYATDESIAIKAASDYDALCPPGQTLARGSDGVFASGTPWVLTSASIDFEDQGVGVNDVVLLTTPKTLFPGSGEFLAVESASGGSLTLRRVGEAAGVGQPPGIGGATGVTFEIETFYPQIEEASFDLNRRYGIDPAVTGRAPSDLYDLRDLRLATVCKVLRDRYTAESRDSRSDFARKAKAMDDELTQVMSRLSVRWAASATAPQSAGWFGMMIVR